MCNISSLVPRQGAGALGPTSGASWRDARLVRGSADLDAGVAESLLDVGDAQVAEVEDAGREHRVRAGLDGRREVFGRARSPAGDQRYADHSTDGSDQLQVEALLRTVRVHRVEQDLPRAQLGPAPRPLDRVQPGRPTAAVRGDLEAARLVRRPARV